MGKTHEKSYDFFSDVCKISLIKLSVNSLVERERAVQYEHAQVGSGLGILLGACSFTTIQKPKRGPHTPSWHSRIVLGKRLRLSCETDVQDPEMDLFILIFS
jgi:hypothetical protein